MKMQFSNMHFFSKTYKNCISKYKHSASPCFSAGAYAALCHGHFLFDSPHLMVAVK